MKDCIFCKIIQGDIPCIKVYENDRVFAFMDINPVADGHILIIPKAHAENIFEIPADDLAAIHVASKRIADGIRKALNTTGIACLQLNGKGVNQIVMHYHLHLIPRRPGSPELPMTKWELVSGNMTRIKEIGEKIASAVK